MSLSTFGRVWLVGAGCGDYDLISLRGKALLEQCDTVIYDSLTDGRLLDFVPENAEKICVGKRSGRHSETQDNINRLLVEKASQGKNVVRLKGGDPFVFGRGGEEILTLKENNIEYGIVPGITSCVAVPELAGIPVTHRETARSFHVITGHTSENLLPENIKGTYRKRQARKYSCGCYFKRSVRRSESSQKYAWQDCGGSGKGVHGNTCGYHIRRGCRF